MWVLGKASVGLQVVAVDCRANGAVSVGGSSTANGVIEVVGLVDEWRESIYLKKLQIRHRDSSLLWGLLFPIRDVCNLQKLFELQKCVM